MAGGADLIAVLLPLYLCVAIGFVWARTDQPFDLRFIAEFVYLVGAPALVLSAIANGRAPLTAVAMMAGAALLSAAVCAALGAGLLRVAGCSGWTELPALALPLAGAIGLTMSRHRFGAEGYALAAGYFAPVAMLAASLGRAASQGTWRLQALAGAPTLWAIGTALALAFGIGSPPRWLIKTTDLLAGMVAPSLMLMIGVSLARTRLALGRPRSSASPGWRSAVLSGWRSRGYWCSARSQAQCWSCKAPPRSSSSSPSPPTPPTRRPTPPPAPPGPSSSPSSPNPRSSWQ